ncbi:MAG TPA: hypothetical protein VFA83_23930, partial [Acidimicrobiales bacterium]|nr:hypothetical protein [Acidimicrobiales bacterium]
MAVAVPLSRPLADPRPEGLQEVVGRARPVTLAGEQLLPVLPELAGLLVGGGLRRGTSVAVADSTTLGLRLLAAASQAGSWCAAVGLPSLGVVAAAEAGLVLERLALVPHPGEPSQWGTIVAALLDALDVVLVRPPARVRIADSRRLLARARERGSVLVALGKWDGADVRLSVAGQSWEGVGHGHGHLRARTLDVVATGRGAAARERRAPLLLSASGAVSNAGDRRSQAITAPPWRASDAVAGSHEEDAGAHEADEGRTTPDRPALQER